MAAKKIKYLVNGKYHEGVFIRAWKEGRSTIVVQVWLGDELVGEPQGDWEMPSVLGATGCIDQAILQTKNSVKK
jgi:hypothetical protein